MTSSTKPRACASPRPLSTKERDRLPARAFGLPSLRKYPMYTQVGRSLVPNPSHASNAKGRALQELTRGNLTATQYATIVAKANKVLAECEKDKTMHKKRAKKKAKKRTKKKATRRKKKATKRKSKKKTTKRKKKATKRKSTKKKATKRRSKKKTTKRKKTGGGGLSMREQQKRIREALAAG